MPDIQVVKDRDIQVAQGIDQGIALSEAFDGLRGRAPDEDGVGGIEPAGQLQMVKGCLLYTSPSPRD